MLNPLSLEFRQKHPAYLSIFSLFVAGHLLIAFTLVYFLRNEVWRRELDSGISSFVWTFLISHLVFCFGEYFFHCDILHSAPIKSLKSFFEKHTLHHSLTSISWEKDANSELLKIKSEYAIEDLSQDVSSTFPIWALAVILSAATPVFTFFSWLFPQVPIFLGGYSALTLTYFLYEGLHTVHHQSNAWWLAKINQKFFGKFWRVRYLFHGCHHANMRCNLNIAGFFGIPVADLILGTYRMPKILLMSGETITRETIAYIYSKSHWLVIENK